MFALVPTEAAYETSGRRVFRADRRGNSSGHPTKEVVVATIEKTIEVDVPVSVAYDQWTQFEEFPQFMTGIEEVRQLDDSHVHWVAEVGGERKEWDAEIVQQEPDRVVAWRSTGGLGNTGRVEFMPIDSGARTRVSVEMDYDTEGAKESLGAFVGADGRQVEKDLERFRELVEARQSPTGAWRGTIESGTVVDAD
jgi:uncharacterized membrane protein